jgi:hypothetical protein
VANCWSCFLSAEREIRNSPVNSRRLLQLLAQIAVQYENKNALVGSGTDIGKDISNRNPGGIAYHPRKLGS